MRVIRDIKKLKRKLKHPVVTLGIFDGVHLGHQRIIKEVIRRARSLKGTSIVLTFDPHPLKIFERDFGILLITALEQRINLIKRMNVDICLLLNFNKEFSHMAAKDFVKHILVDTIGVKYLIIGRGFRFGRNKRGTFSLLKKLSKIYDFKVRRVNPVKRQGKLISSSRIRLLIGQGKIKEANRFLGRAFSIYGHVEPGTMRGRILGYPTANIVPFQEAVPCPGVYAVKTLVDSKIFPGILNIGYRPTFHRKEKPSQTIEAHIFNFHKKIYGKKVEVFFIQHIRPEKKFATHQDLLAQIKKDEHRAKKILKARASAAIYPHLTTKYS